MQFLHRIIVPKSDGRREREKEGVNVSAPYPVHRYNESTRSVAGEAAAC